ncbi:MarR family transcriptional regulator [Thermus thermophilus]|uniref:MarR family transcriptional regulator n=1 Tax=Thermus thermophilus TaxID=274 RepID=UPI001FCB1B90|nr:MarR family transcriptional regulator [Thermus thermophilus]
MATVGERVIALLRLHSEGMTDGELARALGKRRPHINRVCRRLAKKGLLERRVVGGILRNFLVDPPPSLFEPSFSDEHPWTWEGHVQERVARFLEERGWEIQRKADTAKKEPGQDLVARFPGTPRLLWVTVKGYPQGTSKTSPATQARHWFKQAIFDILDWRGRDQAVALAVALPEKEVYRKLADRVRYLQPMLRFSFLWVREDGGVEVDGGLG